VATVAPRCSRGVQNAEGSGRAPSSLFPRFGEDEAAQIVELSEQSEARRVGRELGSEDPELVGDLEQRRRRHAVRDEREEHDRAVFLEDGSFSVEAFDDIAAASPQSKRMRPASGSATSQVTAASP